MTRWNLHWMWDTSAERGDSPAPKCDSMCAEVEETAARCGEGRTRLRLSMGSDVRPAGGRTKEGRALQR